MIVRRQCDRCVVVVEDSRAEDASSHRLTVEVFHKSGTASGNCCPLSTVPKPTEVECRTGASVKEGSADRMVNVFRLFGQSAQYKCRMTPAASFKSRVESVARNFHVYWIFWKPPVPAFTI